MGWAVRAARGAAARGAARTCSTFSCAAAMSCATAGSDATLPRSARRWLSVTTRISGGERHERSWYLKPITIRSKSLSMDASLSRMIDECARRSKTCRTDLTV